MTDAAKIVAATYMAIMTFIFTPIVFDPMQMYQGMVQEDLQDLPATVLDAMKHMSCVYAVLQLLSTSIIVCEVFTHNSPRLGMASIVLSWMLNLVIQFVFPWPANTTILYGISIPSGAMPFIILFTSMGTYGYIHSPHDKAVSHYKKKS